MSGSVGIDSPEEGPKHNVSDRLFGLVGVPWLLYFLCAGCFFAVPPDSEKASALDRWQRPSRPYGKGKRGKGRKKGKHTSDAQVSSSMATVDSQQAYHISKPSMTLFRPRLDFTHRAAWYQMSGVHPSVTTNSFTPMAVWLLFQETTYPCKNRVHRQALCRGHHAVC